MRRRRDKALSKMSRKAAYDYAERIRARLAGRLIAALQEADLSHYGLEDECGISRAMIGRLIKGDCKHVSLVVIAQMSFGLRIRFDEMARRLEDDAPE